MGERTFSYVLYLYTVMVEVLRAGVEDKLCQFVISAKILAYGVQYAVVCSTAVYMTVMLFKQPVKL